VCVIRPAVGCTTISQMEYRVARLQTAAADGLRSAWMALEGEDPELIGTLRAYPRRTAGEAAPSDAANRRRSTVGA
jgi:hypothetical protein